MDEGGEAYIEAGAAAGADGPHGVVIARGPSNAVAAVRGTSSGDVEEGEAVDGPGCEARS